MSHSLYAKLHRYFGARRSGAERLGDAALKAQQFGGALPTRPLQISDQERRGLASITKVIVVGAGFSGLAAAWLCKTLGIPVTILEARNRIGGRVYSLPDFTSGRIIEGGAELIGLNHLVWLHFAQWAGLALSVLTEEDLFAGAGLESPIWIDGSRLTPEEANKLYLEMTAVFARITEDAKDINDSAPWLSPRARELDSISIAQVLDDWQIAGKLRKVIELQFGNDNAVPTKAQSYLSLLALVKGGALSGDPGAFWTETEIFRCASGNEALAKYIYRYVGHKEFHLESPVIKIVIHEASVEVVTGGKVLAGSHVVLAVPPPVWPAVEPSIPPGLIMGAGPAIKYLTNVKDRFWIRRNLAPSGASDHLGMIWEGTDNQTLAEGQGLELSIFAGGPSAQMALNAPNPEEYFLVRIDQMYKGYGKQATGSNRFMKWPEEKWTKTGYSCPAPGQVCSIAPFLNRLYKQRLAFAGEHVSPNFYGYMEGALRSGLLSVVRLAKLTSLMDDITSSPSQQN